jgi:hypothetical protein
MMNRRDFFKSTALLPIGLLPEHEASTEVENILEYATVEITFSCTDSRCPQAHFIVKQTLEALSKWEEDQILIHFHEDENTMYDVGIDELLCSEDPVGQEGLNYPLVKLFHNDRELLLPNISLLTTMSYPNVIISNNNGQSILTNLYAINELILDYEQYPIDSLRISIGGDLKYADCNRYNKIFDISKFKIPEEGI